MKTRHLSIMAFMFVTMAISSSTAFADLPSTGPPIIVKVFGPPLKQIRSGIAESQVNCDLPFLLVLKAEDQSPACIKPEHLGFLLERGWTSPNHLPTDFACSENCATSLLYDYGYICRGLAGQNSCFLKNSKYFENGNSITNQTNVKGQEAVRNQVQSTLCDMPYNPKTGYQSPLYPNGTIIHTDYTPVFYMPVNSTGKICVQYSNPNEPRQAGINIFPANNLLQQANITTSVNPGTIPTGNSTVVYTLKTGNTAGFYGISLFCGGQAFAVGYDNQSKIVMGDFPWYGKIFNCPMMSYNFDIAGISGIGIYYITTTYHEQIDYDITNTTVTSTHPTATIQNVTFAVHIRTFAKPADFWFDYKDSTIDEFSSNPGFKQTTDACNWVLAYRNVVTSVPWLRLGDIQVNEKPVTVPPWSNGTYTFSILAKGLSDGYYGLNPVVYGKTSDLPPERAGTNYIAYDYPITIELDNNMDPSGTCSR